jgi:hypothetical protein
MRHSRPLTALLALAVTALAVAQDPPSAPPTAPPPPPPPAGAPPADPPTGAPRAPRARDGAPREAGPREAGPQDGRPRGGRAGPGGGQPMTVEAAMKSMNRALKVLGEAVTDEGRKDEALRLVSDAQRGCATAKMLPLPQQFMKGAADDAAKAKVQEEYAADLRKTMRMLLDVEDAIVAGRGEEAKAILAKVEEMRQHAHKELGVDE